MKNIKILLALATIIAISLISCKNDDKLLGTQGILRFESNSSNIDEWCTSLFFNSETEGYATTQDGEIFKTMDGGEKWVLMNSASSVPLRTIYFLNKDIGYAFGGESKCSPSPCEPSGSVAFKTINGGKSWQRQNVPYKWSELNSAYFFNANNGIAVGLGLCIKTSNGGITWQSFTIGKNNISKISFANRNVGYALDLMGGFFKTEDSGLSWKNISVSEDKITLDFCFISDKIGYANDLNKLLKTTDGGKSWNLIATAENSINYIYFVNEDSGIILSKKYLNESGMGFYNPWKHIVQLTNDGGQTWSTQELGEEELNERCLFSKDNIIYSLSQDKIIKLIIE